MPGKKHTFLLRGGRRDLFPASAASANTKEYSLGNFISRKTLFGIEKAA